ncbi:MAG TPA: hypothetical protein VHU90_07740, partial [Galbitalea sp.]|nr:hypothetical protein [Galbitalea sp.]
MSVSGGPRIVLPGSWLRVDLTSEATTRASIRRLIEAGVGRADSLAALRSQLRSELQTGADIARQGSAVEFFVAQSIAPGIPLAATLSVHLPDIDEARLRSLGLGELVEVIDDIGVVDRSDSRTVAAEREIRVVRQVSHSVARRSSESVAVPVVKFDYWMATSDPARLALLAFSTTFVDFESQL